MKNYYYYYYYYYIILYSQSCLFVVPSLIHNGKQQLKNFEDRITTVMQHSISIEGIKLPDCQ